mgnify:CR=1 FL=1
MLEFPGGRGSGGIGCFGEYVGNVCRKCGCCVGKGEDFGSVVNKKKKPFPLKSLQYNEEGAGVPLLLFEKM